MVAIVFRDLTKTYGKFPAVNNFSAEVKPGRVTGFLGPNGAGKSTALRCLVGLAKPTSGKARILGKRYPQLKNPSTRVGVVLDSRGFHPGPYGLSKPPGAREHGRAWWPTGGRGSCPGRAQ